MYTIPDELHVYYEVSFMFSISTGGLVSNDALVYVSFGSAASTSSTVTVEMNAPNSCTLWEVEVSRPPLKKRLSLVTNSH